MQLLRYVLSIQTARQIALMVLVVASVGLSFGAIALEGRIIDDAIKTGSLANLKFYALSFLAVVLITHALEYLVDILYARLTQRILIKLRTDLFSHVLRLGLGFFHKNSVGEVLSRLIPEVQQLGNFLSRLVVVPLSCTLTILAGFGLVAGMDWRLGLTSAAIFSLVFLFLPRLRARLDQLAHRSPLVLREISRRTEESLSHHQEIHAHQTYAFEESRFRKGLDDFYRVNVDLAGVFGQTSFLNRTLAQLATLSVYTLGGYLAITEAGQSEGLTVGEIFVVIRALSNVMSPITTLIDYFQKYREAAVRFRMIVDYLNLPAEMVDRPGAAALPEARGPIELAGVNFGFEPGQTILRQVSLTIAPGEHVALVGPAGCGKSTVTLLIDRLVRPDEGAVRFAGRDLAAVQLSSLRAGVGYLAQAKTSSPLLFSGTLLDNLLYGLRRGEASDGSFLDLEGAGYPDRETLYQAVVETLRQVGFYEDVLGFGLTKVSLRQALEAPSLFPILDAEAIRNEILKGRKRLSELLAGEGDLVELFGSGRFLEHGNLLENLVFTSPGAEAMAQVLERLPESELAQPLMQIGARSLIDLTSLGPTAPQLAARFGLTWEDEFSDLAERLRNRPAHQQLVGLAPADSRRLLRLGLEYDPSRALENYLEADLKARLVAARPRFQAAPEARYDSDNFVDAATLRENLVMGKVNLSRHRADERVEALVRQVCSELELEDEAIRLGLMMDVGERGARLSGGQAQKAALARVLLKRPGVLILDEATSALDNASQEQIHKLLTTRYRQHTVVQVAHRLDSIKDADRIVVLKAGQVVEAGSFPELMESRGLFFQLWNSAYGGQ